MKRLEGDFDYIVVGAGTAGCIVANRLSADPKNRVLILEAGGNDDWIWFHIPVGYLFAIGNPRSDWMFRTEPEPGLNGRSLAYPRGKVIGGSSAINAMISMRGQAADYDHWRQLGLSGWGYDDVLPAFRRLEDHFLGESEHHGSGGGWRIEAPRLSWAILDAVGDAAEQMGIRKIPDFNTGDNEGVGYFHVNQKRGRRWSSARGFLKPALKRANLRLEKDVLVDRLIVENGRAVGVLFTRGGDIIEARARGEVILCAGSIGSAQVLHRSGIGPAEWLTPLGIESVLDRQGVGRNLQDHLCIDHLYRSRLPTLNQELGTWPGRVRVALRYALLRRGPLAISVNQGGGFVRTRPDLPRPDMQLYFSPLSYTRGVPGKRALMRPDPFPGFLLSAQPCRPTSRGHLEIRSSDPLAPPLIHPNALSTEDDIHAMLDGTRFLRQLAAAPSLAAIIAEEMAPGPGVQSDADLLEDIRQRASSVFHPVSSCRMGPDPGADVVDADLRVYGVEGLRVIDASIFPAVTSGNTNAPTIMVAEKGADLVLRDV